MALILNLETATKTCSVALAFNGDIIACQELTTEKFSHAEKLNLFIEDVLKEAEMSLNDIEAVAISAGPGSYTGLRIGVSTAKGLCYALEKPLIAVNSLKALATRTHVETGLICPMFDARRMEVYCALYDRNLQKVRDTDAVVIDENSFCEILDNEKIHFIGPGAEKCKDLITNENAIFDLNVDVSAKGMASLSEAKFNARDFEDVAYFEPTYLKDFIAGKPKKLL